MQTKYDDPEVIRKLSMVTERLQKSKSGFVLVKRFGVTDRTALSILRERNEVEIFQSALGNAYRLVSKAVELKKPAPKAPRKKKS